MTTMDVGVIILLGVLLTLTPDTPDTSKAQNSGNTQQSDEGSAAGSPHAPTKTSQKRTDNNATNKKPGAPNSDCAHLDLHAGDKLPAMIGSSGVIFRLPNGTWCSLSSHSAATGANSADGANSAAEGADMEQIHRQMEQMEQIRRQTEQMEQIQRQMEQMEQIRRQTEHIR